MNNSLKILHTNISLTRFIICQTHQSLKRKQKWFQDLYSEGVNTKIFCSNFSSSNFQQMSTFNQVDVNCEYSITRNSNESLFFSQNKGMPQIRCSPLKTVFSFLVLQKDNSLSEHFSRISWNLFDTKPVSSHSFRQTW